MSRPYPALNGYQNAALQVPAKATSGDVRHRDAEADERAQPVKEAGPLVTGRECGMRSNAVCDERGVLTAAYDPAALLLSSVGHKVNHEL